MDHLTENFNYALLDLLYLVAPATTRKRFQKSPMPWLNDALLLLRKNCSQFEGQWRGTKLEVQYQARHDCLFTYQSEMSAAKAAYYSNLIMNNKHDPGLLFGTVSRLTQDRQPVASTTLSARDFMEYPSIF